MRDEEDVTAELLRLAGARPHAPADRASRVRTAVQRQWQSTCRRRAIRRRAAITTVLLAAAAAFVLMVRPNPPRVVPQSPLEAIVATAERIEGEPLARRQIDGRSRDLRLSLHAPLRAHDVIGTDRASRAAWRSVDGSSVRLDRDSQARLISSMVIELLAGAVYIATSEGSHGFEVRTPLGAVHDVGTRFEVRLGEASLRIRVRTGLVEIRRRAQIVPAPAGSEATITASNVVTRPVSTYGSDWEWTSGLGSSFKIEGRSLSAYLQHLAMEEGWTVRYANARLADTASAIILHGSVEGLRAEDALGVALTTSGLQYRLREGELLVFRANAY